VVGYEFLGQSLRRVVFVFVVLGSGKRSEANLEVEVVRDDR
jgi:hypothetical protein